MMPLTMSENFYKTRKKLSQIAIRCGISQSWAWLWVIVAEKLPTPWLSDASLKRIASEAHTTSWGRRPKDPTQDICSWGWGLLRFLRSKTCRLRRKKTTPRVPSEFGFMATAVSRYRTLKLSPPPDQPPRGGIAILKEVAMPLHYSMHWNTFIVP